MLITHRVWICKHRLMVNTLIQALYGIRGPDWTAAHNYLLQHARVLSMSDER